MDLVDRIFGDWHVIEEAAKRGHKGQKYWKCRCTCGTIREVAQANLTTNKTQGCGCSNGRKSLELHGMWGTPEYRSWDHMLSRCTNPNNDSYSYYGGRGITVCDRWRNSFMAFFEDMGPRPDGLTLERVNNDSNYCRENCIWGTWEEQMANRRTNKNNTSGEAGIYYSSEKGRRKPWRLDKTRNGRRTLGRYHTFEEAKAAKYAAAA